MAFHPQQKSGIDIDAAGDAAQLLYHQTHMMIVEMNTLFHGLLHGVPVCLLEALLRPARHFQKTAILSIKALQNGLRNQ